MLQDESDERWAPFGRALKGSSIHDVLNKMDDVTSCPLVAFFLVFRLRLSRMTHVPPSCICGGSGGWQRRLPPPDVCIME